MIFHDSAIPGVTVIDPEPHHDSRGFFARTWCQREFQAYGLVGTWVQGSVSVSRAKGTIRGMHFQQAPYEEAKLIRCLRGAIYDVVVDLRPGSRTFLQHVTVTLSADKRNLLYIPPGCAHGFQTLEDDCEVEYQMSEYHRPEAGRGVRWDDPVFGIQWPLPVTSISDRDRTYPDFVPDVVRNRS